MNGTCGLTFKSVLAFAILSVIDHEISKRNVTCNKVVLVLVFQFSNSFKRLVANEHIAFTIGVQGLADAGSEQILFHCIYNSSLPCKGLCKGTHASRRIQTSTYGYIYRSESIRDGRNDTGIGIEGGQYACLDALPVPLGGIGI